MADLTGIGASVTADELMVRADYAYAPPDVFHSGVGSPADVPGVLDVTDFGAVADAAVDNRAAIQAAIDAAEAAGGGLVYIPAGTYGILPEPGGEGAIKMKDNVYLIGDGMGETTLRLVDGSDTKIVGLIRSPWGGNTDNWGIADLTVDGNRAGTTNKVDGLYSGGIPGDVLADHDVTWLRIEARDFSGYGFDPHERTVRLLIADSVAHGNGLDGFVADHCIDSVYRNNLAYDNDRHGFNIVTTSNDFTLKDNVARDNGASGIMVQRGSELIEAPHNILIDGGRIEGNDGEGIQLWMASNVLVTGVEIADSGTYGIRLRGTASVTVEDTTITGSSQLGANRFSDIQLADYYDAANDRTYSSYDNLIRGTTITADPATPSSRGIDEKVGAAPGTVDHNAFIDNEISGQVRGPVSVTGATSFLRHSGTDGADSIAGGSGEDTLSGGNAADTIGGGGGADALSGESGDDSVSGGDGDDSIDGGAGGDALDGGAGSDTYLYRNGDGSDVISDAAGADRIVLDIGIALADVSAGRTGDDLVLSLDGGGSMTVAGHFASDEAKVETLELADGTTFDLTALTGEEGPLAGGGGGDGGDPPDEDEPDPVVYPAYGAAVSADDVMVRPAYAYTPPDVFYDGGTPAAGPDVFNVLDHGAVASASVDNRAAIQAAIDAAEAAGGGLVHIPAGTYGMLPDPRDDGVIQLKDNVYLMGDGMGETTLKLMDGSDTKIVGLIRSPWGGNTDNWGVVDLTVDGNRSATTGKVDAFYSGGIPGDVIADHDVTWLRVEAMNCSGYGFDPHERTYRLLIEDCVAHGNGLDGFVADHVIDSVYRNNLAYGNDRHGFNLVTTSNDMLLTGNIARENGVAGIAVQRGSEDIATPHNIRIEGGELVGNGREGIQLWMTSNVLITGVDIRDSGTYGIRIRGASHVTVENSTVTNSSASGADAYPDIQIVDYYDIALDRTYQARDNLIRNNTIIASATTPSSRGIDERTPTGPDAAAVDHNAFIGNTISGQVRGLVSVSGAASVLRLDGSALADTIRGGGSGDRLAGGDGDDAIEGRGGADALRGDRGADSIKGGDGDDTVTGGAGNDRLDGEAGHDRLAGSAGDDRLIGGSGKDTLSGGAANDYVTGGSGRDLLSGGAGDDKLDGEEGADRLNGGKGIDTLIGGDGDDVLTGRDDADSLYGGAGHDRLIGGRGDDKLLGESGHDRLDGSDGADTLDGGADRDRLHGGDGNDKLIGGADRDILTGGSGRDLFVLAPGDGRDVITDFEPGEDRIDLSGFDISGFKRLEKLMDDTSKGLRIELDRHTSLLILDVKADDLDKGDLML